jgi:uncharacterized protein
MSAQVPFYIQEVLGREIEQEYLDKVVHLLTPSFIVVHGRRRVGKTFLIRQHLHKYMLLDFTGTHNQGNKVQLANFKIELQKQCKVEVDTLKSWQDAFNILTDVVIERSKQKKPMVIFFDEMPWLDDKRHNFVSALEYFWNQTGSKVKQLKVIACGSSATWLKTFLLNSTEGLYNRVTHELQLKPYTLAQTQNYLKHKIGPTSYQDTIKLYMALGGVPHYLQHLQKGRSIVQLIDDLCFKPNAPLISEYEKLYYSLFKNAEKHIRIVEELAQHHYGLTQSKIVALTKLPQASVSRALAQLVDCDFIATCSPFGKFAKDKVYRLIDMYSLFYHRFMKDKSNNATWLSIFDTPKYFSWCGYAFENICLIHAKQIQYALDIGGMFCSYNSWLHKGNDELPGAQIDLLIDRPDNCITICEAKYSDNQYAMTKLDTASLKEKRTVFKAVTKTKKQLFTCLVTVNSPVNNAYLQEHYQHVIEAKHLFIDRNP